MIPGPPITLSGGAVSLIPPVDATQLAGVLLVNSSGYLLQLDGLDQPRTLQPWTADLFALGNGARVTATPLLATAPAGATAYLQPTWALAGEDIPGQYPLTLTANAVASLVSFAPASQVQVIAATASGTNLIAQPTPSSPPAGHFWLLRRLSVTGPANTNAILTVGGQFVNGTSSGALDEDECTVPITVPAGQAVLLTWSSKTGADIHTLAATLRLEYDDRTS